jgi:NAD(P)-dependent dehydrogenase (short-subunit alcohol dehydrogenase family)
LWSGRVSSASGIGEACCQLLAERGALVVVVDIAAAGDPKVAQASKAETLSLT